MKPTNEAAITFLSRSANEGFARTTAACFAAQLDPTLEEINDIKTAVSEAVTNCIVHAYKGGTGTVTIECETDGNALHIQITDNGKGIEDVPRALEPFYTTLSDEERSGMGFTIMQTFMNDFRVQSKKGTGTTVFMSKYFNRNDGTDELADAE